MKILLLTVTCGEGHNAIAKALKESFEKQNQQVKMVQVFGYDEKRLKRENKLFLFACRYIPHIYDKIWNNLRKKNTKENLPGGLKKAYFYVEEQINEFDPDIIVATHNYGSTILSVMKKEGKLKNVMTGAILHDQVVCPFWEKSKRINYIFAPFDNTNEELLFKGFRKDQIKVTGIPVAEKFKNIYLKEPEMFTVTLIGGGNAVGGMGKLVESLCDLPIKIVCINGHNKQSFNSVQKLIEDRNLKNVENLGFTNQVADIYSRSSLIISRCGGGSFSEILAIGVPFITREGLIINEKIAQEFFEDAGCSLAMHSIEDARKYVGMLLDSPQKLAQMKENIKKFSKPNATDNIVKFLLTRQIFSQN